MMEKKVHVSWTFQEQNPGKPWKLYQIPGISMEFHVIPWISSLSSMITLDNVQPGRPVKLLCNLSYNLCNEILNDIYAALFSFQLLFKTCLIFCIHKYIFNGLRLCLCSYDQHIIIIITF